MSVTRETPEDEERDENLTAAISVPPVTIPADTKRPRLPSAAPVQDRQKAFLILMMSVMCLGMGQTILFAVLPPLARQIGLTEMQVGMIFTCSALLWVFCSPFWGRRSDVWGRKPTILLGLLAFALSMVSLGVVTQVALTGAMAVIPVFVLMVMTRAIHGGFGSAGPSSAQAYIADRTSREERTGHLANFMAAFGLGSTLGPGIGSAAAAIGPVAPIYVVAVIAVGAAIAIFIWLPENAKPQQRGDLPKLSFMDPRLRWLLLFGVLGGFLNVVPLQVIGFYLMDVLELDESNASQLLGVALMVMSMASLFVQLVLVQRLKMSPALLLRLSPILMIAGHGLIALGSEFGVIVFGLLLTGLGTGMYFPGFTAAASLAVRPEEQGAAAGLGNSAMATGYILAPVVGFTLYKIAPQVPFYVTSALGVLLVIFTQVNKSIRHAGQKLH
jgi:MFS family permease